MRCIAHGCQLTVSIHGGRSLAAVACCRPGVDADKGVARTLRALREGRGTPRQSHLECELIAGGIVGQ